MNFICMKNKEEYIKFINDVKENFHSVEDWERFFGFHLKYDEETGEPLETIFEYQGDIRCCPDSFPAIIYSTFDNSRDRWGELGIRIVDFVTFEELGILDNSSKKVNEEDVLKFYYCESLDKYLVGQRVDTLYYGEVMESGDLYFYMSRYLPWDEHVIMPDTLWKEHIYPSEPKEISFSDWLKGYMKQKQTIKE